MTLENFGARLNTTRQAAHRLEKSELTGSITVKRLRCVAEALECELVIYLKPRASLEKIVNDRAREVAHALIARTSHTMAMEAQSVSESHIQALVDEMAEEMVKNADNRIWQ